MSIPPRFLEEIRSRLTLSELVGKRVRLTRAGREFKGCCPFHREKSPSFTVNDDKQFYHCFGCGAHGDVIGFTMQHDNLSFIDAVSSLAALAGLQMPEFTPQDKEKADKSRDLYALMDEAARWMQEQLRSPAHDKVREYLLARGLASQSLENFRLGFAPDDRHALKKHLLQKGYREEAILEAGLIKKPESGGEAYVFFRGRVMFPVMDRRGRVVAFGGRILPDHMRGPDSPGFTPAKYMNSGDTPLFDKGRMLYAEGPARLAAREGLPVLVTEGYMDVIACHQAGFRGAVAPMSTALTEAQIVLLWSMIPGDLKMPVLCFDGDNAGRKAAQRACERLVPLLKPGHSARIAFLPEGEDPDSLLKKSGRGALQGILDSALTLFDFIWMTHIAGCDTRVPEMRAAAVQGLNAQIAKIADREVQSHYQHQLRERVSATFFQRTNTGAQNHHMGQKRAGGASRGGSGLMPSPLKPRRPAYESLPARILLAAVINHPSLFTRVEEALSRMHLANGAEEKLRQGIFRAFSDEADLDRGGLQHNLMEQGLERELRDTLCESVYLHAAFARPASENTGQEDDPLALDQLESLWRQVFEAASEPPAQDEIRSGWQNALLAEDAAAEDRLRVLSASIWNKQRTE